MRDIINLYIDDTLLIIETLFSMNDFLLENSSHIAKNSVLFKYKENIIGNNYYTFIKIQENYETELFFFSLKQNFRLKGIIMSRNILLEKIVYINNYKKG